MAFHPITAFKNPVTRPRAIIWTGTILAILCLVMVVMVGATTSYWFCAEICHKVQDDSIFTYNRSTHSKVSCVSCHMPVNDNVVTFLLHKVELLAELPMTVAGTYSIPLNAESEVSLNKKMFPDTQCTQCHELKNRVVNASSGIIIDHTVHTDSGVRCTMCHNRVAHNEEGYQFINSDPKTGKLNGGHDNFMKMTACYRCHGLEKGSPAPGTCATCHPKDFKLKPSDHQTADFMKKHGELALEETKHVKEVEEESGVKSPDALAKTNYVNKLLTTKDQKAESKFEWPVAPVGTVNRCYTCHDQKTFCDKCHGVEMPHTTAFLKDHSTQAKNPELAKKCVMCHGDNNKTNFCNSCHHGKEVNWTYDSTQSWTNGQHAKAVAKSGIESCTKQCHTAKFCSDCHSKMKNPPASHKVANFTYAAKPSMTVYGKTDAQVTAKHALEAQKSTKQCEICHGTGGVNAQFCKNCHGMTMPHSDSFKKFHSKQDAAKCKKCHNFKQVCSNCHHVGSSTSKSWISVHGSSVNKNGYDTCVGPCHKKSDCTSCHMKNRVLPDSHKAKKFVKGGLHATAYDKDSETCTFCHSGNAASLPNSKTCKSCHKLDMPHKINKSSAQKFEHKTQFEKKTYTKKMCATCHSTRFCDACHHTKSVEGKQWMYYHPTVVHKDGADNCYKCHQETYCSHCHVNLPRK